MSQSDAHFLPRNVYALPPLPHGHALHKGHVVLHHDVRKHVNYTHLGELLQDVLLLVLVKFGIEGLLLDLVGASLYLVDALPELFLLDLKREDLVFELIGFLAQSGQVGVQFSLLFVKFADFLDELLVL